jgi:hypothetical protein
MAEKKEVATEGRIAKGASYVCEVCGLAVSVDEVCGCVDVCDIICCGKLMKERKVKVRTVKK